MHSPEINGEGELRGQRANPGSPGKMAVKMECMCSLHKTVFSSGNDNNGDNNNNCNNKNNNSTLNVIIQTFVFAHIVSIRTESVLMALAGWLGW